MGTPADLQREAVEALRAGRHAEAERGFRELAAAYPHPSVLVNLGIALVAQRREAEAVPVFEAAIAARPDSVNARLALANALLQCGREAEALARCDEALRLEPGQRDARINRATALRALNRVEEAAAEFADLLAADPGDADAEYNLALAELTLGRFGPGWRHYEARWRGSRGMPAPPGPALPPWRPGEAIAGRAVLAQAEQGLGDTLQFMRFVDAAARECARLDLQVQPALVALARRRWPALRIQAAGEAPAPGLEMRLPLLSLPLALGIGDPGPADPYLVADEARVAQWRSRLRPCARRVGFAWRGNPAVRHDWRRSMPIEALLPWIEAAGRAGIGAVAVQREVDARERAVLARFAHVEVPGEALADFEDTAAVLALVDRAACVDTSVIHLAGALGRPADLLLSFPSDWRWGIDRPDGSTYRSVRTLRQARPGDWDSVVRPLIDRLP